MGGGCRGARTGRVGDGGWEIDPEAFSRAGAFDLMLSEREGASLWGVEIIHPIDA